MPCNNYQEMASPNNYIKTTVDINIGKGADFEVTDTRIIVYNVPLTGEIVQQYSDGFAFKPAQEVAKIDVKNVPVTFLHPGTSVGAMPTPAFADNAQGFLRKPTLDRKTTAADPKKLYADIVLFRTADTQVFEDALSNGTGIDVSIGFEFILDPTPGTHNGQAYDYVQRNMRLDHLAILIDEAGFVHPGRAPFPFYGIGADSKNKPGDHTMEKTVSEELYKGAVDEANTLKTANDKLTAEVETLKADNKKANDALVAETQKAADLQSKLDAQEAEIKEYRDAKAADRKTKIDALKAKYPAMDSMFDTASDEAIKKAYEDMQKGAKDINAVAGDGTNAGSTEKVDLTKHGYNKPFKGN